MSKSRNCEVLICTKIECFRIYCIFKNAHNSNFHSTFLHSSSKNAGTEFSNKIRFFLSFSETNYPVETFDFLFSKYFSILIIHPAGHSDCFNSFKFTNRNDQKCNFFNKLLIIYYIIVLYDKFYYIIVLYKYASARSVSFTYLPLLLNILALHIKKITELWIFKNAQYLGFLKFLRN